MLRGLAGSQAPKHHRANGAFRIQAVLCCPVWHKGVLGSLSPKSAVLLLLSVEACVSEDSDPAQTSSHLC